MAEEKKDNSGQENEQFNSVLNAAQKHVNTEGDGNGDLTQEQIAAMLAEENGEDPEAAVAAVEAAEAAEAARVAAEAASAVEDNGGEKKKKKEKAPKPKKEKKPINKAVLARVLTVVGVIAAAAIGFMASVLAFSDFIKTSDEQLAIRAANAVNSKLPINSEFYIYRAYVRNGAAMDECMLYGLTSYGGTDKMDIYRIVVEHDEPNVINIYYTLDENSPEYIAMKQSDDDKTRIQASQLKNHSDAIAAADKEIQGRSPKWKKVDCTMINRHITSAQVKNK